MTSHDNGRWLVLIDWPGPEGRRFVNRKRAERWGRRRQREGKRAILVDLSVALTDMKPEEIT